MLRNELTHLKPIPPLDCAIGFVALITASAGAYFLDGARIAAFGIVPAIFVFSFSGLAGISLKKTPRLFALCLLVALLFYVGATGYVWLNPKSL